MGAALALSVSGFCGGLLILVAAAFALTFPKVPAARLWAASWGLSALGCLFVALAPLVGPYVTGTAEVLVRTCLVLGSQLALALGFLTWFGYSPAEGKGALVRTILWGGSVLALVPVGLGQATRDPVAWTLVAAWSLVPTGVSVGLVWFHGLSDPRSSVRAQASAFLWALSLGSAPYLVTWILLPSLSDPGWSLGFVPFLVLAAGLIYRALAHHDTRFPHHHGSSFLVERTQDPVLFLQADGRIQAANPAFLSLLDRDEASLVGVFPSSLGADPASVRLLVPLEALGFPDWEGTLNLAHRSGRDLPVHLVYRRVHNPAREAVGAVLLVHDQRTPQRLDLTAREDALTSLANRRWVLELLEAEFQRVKRYGGPLAALWIEVDPWYDSDDILRRIASVLRGGLRKTDFCGRVGATQFLAVLPETSAERATLVATRLEKMYALASEGEVAGGGLRVGVADLDQSMVSKDDFLARVRASVPQTGSPS